jgi:hypothetical protein
LKLATRHRPKFGYSDFRISVNSPERYTLHYNLFTEVELYLRPLLAKLTLPQAPSHHSAYPAVISQPHYPTTLTVSQLGYYFIAQTNNIHHNEQDKQLHLQKNV